MTEEEKLEALKQLTANGAQIGQLNLGDGHQYFGCQVNQSIDPAPSTHSYTQTIEDVAAEPIPTHQSPSKPPLTPEERFKYIHPHIYDDTEKDQITLEIQNLVRTQPMPDICHYLMDMKKANRIYLNVKPKAALTELHRMGMPDETHEGFTYNNFTKYYNIN